MKVNNVEYSHIDPLEPIDSKNSKNLAQGLASCRDKGVKIAFYVQKNVSEITKSCSKIRSDLEGISKELDDVLKAIKVLEQRRNKASYRNN